ncbi:MAG: hypothetical protein GX663_06370 [Clostridiales bacterium]|nr:hypothetical protein [Clostridiales bacterium]
MKRKLSIAIFTLMLILLGTSASFFTEGAYAALPDDDNNEITFPAPDNKDAGDEPPEDALFWVTTETLTPNYDNNPYDVSTYGINTQLLINKPGDYYLKGVSTNVFVTITSGGVNLYLQDGLVIDPFAGANVGAATPAIDIKDQGGEVKIITCAGAKCALRGYFSGTIRKNGTNTKLTFATAGTSNSGYLRVVGGRGFGDAAIGSETGKSTGNIFFESGQWRVEPRSGSSIGAGADGSVDGITFNGGAVTAFGTTDERFTYPLGTAAIGTAGGPNTCADNIVINGGTVKATGGSANFGYYCGAAIGGGSYSSVGTITINGGNVRANGGNTNHGGASGIGGGNDCPSTKQIKINGGSVNATGGNSCDGIGGSSTGNVTITGGSVTARGGANGALPSCGSGIGARGSIVITGGNVTATGGSGGIRGGGQGIASGNVNISGGIIKATGSDRNSGGIGHGGGTLSISGGTIIARASSGGKDLAHGMNNLYISGGTINASSWGATPYNKADGDEVYKTAVTLEDYDTSSSGKATNALAQALTVKDLSYDYGLDDVYGRNANGNDGKSYFLFLPEGNAVTTLQANDNGSVPATSTTYGGYIETTSDHTAEGTLYPADKLILTAGEGGTNGSALASYLQSEAQSFVPATKTGYVVTGYSFDMDGKDLLLGNEGRFYKSVSYGDKIYTDKDGKYQKSDSSSNADIPLYAQYIAATYDVVFDKNLPDDASTKSAATGTMQNQKMIYGVSANLKANAYALPGYNFAGWNTEADGSGARSYSDEYSVSNLTSEDKGHVTLYAQWTPKTYSVIFNNGDSYATGTMDPITLTFDKPVSLPPNIYSLTDKTFAGWSRGALGSLYKNEATVCNLCGKPYLPSVTLTAQWAEEDSVTVILTDNGQPVKAAKDLIKLEKDETKFGGFTGTDGIYTVKNIATGTYDVILDGALSGYSTEGKTVTVADNTASLVHLDYATVEISKENEFITDTWIEDPVSKKPVTELLHQPIGSQLKIGSTTADGYSFESYTALLNDPVWENDDNTEPNQTITITGETIIEAHPTANLYKLSFDKNANDTIGYMDNQDMVYDEPQDISKCRFTRPGYDFKVWTLTDKWTGTEYKDGENVTNLTDVKDAVVKLYAQWDSQPYYIHFDDNGSHGLMLNQKLFHDTASKLSKCEFELEDWHFAGWNTQSNGEGKSYGDEEEVTNLTNNMNETATLYAQWEHDTFTLSFNANGGEGSMDPQDVWTNSGYPMPLCDFTKKGYSFTAWNTKANGSGTSLKAGDVADDLAKNGETATVYAQWEKNPDGGDKHDNGTNTGDSRNILLPIILIILGAVGIIASAIGIRRRK